MKPLTQFLEEKSVLNFRGFLISRASMPQINNVEMFSNYLESIGIVSDYNMIHSDVINTTQTNFDRTKIDNMKLKVDDIEEDNLRPIVIANDYYVLDGHHRLIAYQESNNKEIHALVVDVTINQLLRIAYDYKELHTDG